MLSILVFNMQLPTIAPHYSHLGGDQSYYPLILPNSTNSTSTEYADTYTQSSPILCNMTDSTASTGPDACIHSQIAILADKLHTQFPFFGGILFLSNVVFISTYGLFTFFVIFFFHAAESHLPLRRMMKSGEMLYNADRTS